MPLAKWYLIANTDALLLLGCAAMFFCGMGVIVADEASEHTFLWKLVCVFVSLIVTLILAAFFVEAFTGRGWR